MSAAELAAWREMAAQARAGVRPCVDCPREFALEMGACCNGEPGLTVRPRLSSDVTRTGQGRRYSTDADRIAARRQTFRESKRRARAAA